MPDTQYFLTQDGQLKAVGSSGLGLAKDSGWKPVGTDLAAARELRDKGSFGGQAKTAAETVAKGAFDVVTGIPRALSAAESAISGRPDMLEHVSGDHFLNDLYAVGSELAGGKGAEAAGHEQRLASQQRAEANPLTAAIGYGAGQIGGALATGGVSALAKSGVTEALGGGLAARLAGSAAAGAIEGAPMAMTQAQHDAYLEGRTLTAEQNVASLGVGALLGGGLSAGMTGLGEVFGAAKGALGSRFGAAAAEAGEAGAQGEKSALRRMLHTGDEPIENSIASVTGQEAKQGSAEYVRQGLKGHALGEIQATEQGAAARSLRSNITEMEEATKNLSPEWREAKAVNVAKTIDRSEGAFESQSKIAQDQVGTIRDRLAEMKADPAAYGDRAVLNKLERHVTVAEREIGSAIEAGKGEDVFVALDSLKRKMGPLAKPGRMLSVAADAESSVEVRKLYDGLRDSLTDSAWGEAGQMQKGVNGAYEQWLATKKLFDQRFMTETGREGWQKTYGVDPGKVEPWVNGLGKSRNDLTQSIIEQHIQNTKNLAEALAAAGEMTPEKAAELASVKNAATKFGKTVGEIQEKMGAIDQAKTFIEKATGAQGGVFGSSVLGGMVHGPVGAAAGAVLGAAANPAKFLAQRIQFEQAASSMGQKLGTALDGFFKPMTGTAAKVAEAAQAGANVVSKAKVPTALGAFGAIAKTPELAFQKRADEIQMAAADNGSGVRNAMSAKYGALSTADPDSYSMAVVAASRALAFLQGKMPETGPNLQSLTPLTSKIQPSKLEIAQFATVWNAVNNPLTVIDSLKDGTLQPDQVEAVKAVYPKLYEWMQTETLGKLRDLDTKGVEVPVRQRMMLDTLLDLNGAGEPAFAPSFGAKYGAQMGDPPAQQRPPPRPSGSTGSISKSSRTQTSMMIGGA